ncbi:MAG: SAM-dependent methyltransferase [Leptolyngbya sp. ERB_1_1]
MTATRETKPRLTSRIVSGILSIPPVFNLARVRARNMMIKRAELIGVPWTEIVADLQARDWSAEFEKVNNPDLEYPEYYLRPFHAYEAGNLAWEPATEVEVAAYAVHARIWKDAGKDGDRRLRQSYHDVLESEISTAPKAIVDFGCSVGMSTVALQETFPDSTVTGVDLSPHFLAVAEYRTGSRENINWRHAAAEATGLPSASYDLVSACLLFHELPQDAAITILQEARRLLRPGGHLAIMDMNPRSEVHAKMPPYILTLLKSTEPYLDQYFTFDLERAIVEAGFTQPTLTCNSPRHRTLVAQAC